MDFKKHINEIEKKINYKFKDKSLLEQAFTRSSYCNEKNYGGKESYASNEVLEFFGDSVLSVAIVGMLLENMTERFEHGIRTSLDEGGFSLIRSKLSDKKNLSKSTAMLGLEKYLLVGEGDEKLGIRDEPSVMEDLFESIVGAIYIDSGKDIFAVSASINKMLDISVYSSSEPPMQNPKNALQEWCADKKNRLPAPVYKTVSESGPDHKKVYERGVYIGERLVAVGSGKNQKLADTAAAEAALETLKREHQPQKQPSDALVRLRAHASQNKHPSPEFRDLGETPTSSEQAREFIVECRYLGFSESATGRSKQEAREAACDKILLSIAEAEKPQGKKGAASTQNKKKKTAATVQNKQKGTSAHKGNTTSPEESKAKPTSKPEEKSVSKSKPVSKTKSKHEQKSKPLSKPKSKPKPASKATPKAAKKPTPKKSVTTKPGTSTKRQKPKK